MAFQVRWFLNLAAFEIQIISKMNSNLIITRKRLSISREWQIILLFASLKLFIHFLTFSNFELHRDAYLYYAQSEHLDWGYFSAPPTTALLGKIATLIFGNTTFALRFFPALIGALSIIIIGLAIKELGGRNTAVILACSSFLLSPAYLHVNALFQPVAMDIFYWLFICYLILVLIKRNNPKLWIWIAIVSGFAFLNKYSIVFLLSAFAISLLFSKQRMLFTSKYFIIAMVICLSIIFPNLLWQYRYGFPILDHMAELRETQLVHVKISDFLFDQFLMNIHAIMLWVGALFIILFNKHERQYRLFAFIYLVVITLLILGSGKSYYSLGIYPILFVFGAYFTEKYIKSYLKYLTGFLFILMFICLYFSIPFDGVPLSTFEKTIKKDAFRWEDGKYHDLPQDMADMTGWKEIGQKVSDIYMSLGEDRKNCDIWCNHYGQAGAVMFYGKEINIPQPISFNGSFLYWAPDSLEKDYMIWVHDDRGSDMNPDTLLPQLFKSVELKATIDNKYFRENGTRIYLCRSPADMLKNYYTNRIKELKGKYRKQ